jgi:hypothetical protein
VRTHLPLRELSERLLPLSFPNYFAASVTLFPFFGHSAFALSIFGPFIF